MPQELEFTWLINDDGAGDRLDVFLANEEDPPLSRSQIKRRIDRGEVLVNHAQVKAGYELKRGDKITFSFRPDKPPNAKPQEIPLSILFEDQHLAIVDKPAGMVVHPSIGHPDQTLVNALLYHFEKVSTGSDILRPGIVHRIDKDTSGALVIAKSDLAHRHLSALFATHEIERVYDALVFGPGLPDRGTFDTLHGRDPSNRIKFTSLANRGKRAVTHFQVVERFPGDEICRVECRLETGRTHQIRVHFADANAPLLGDQLYGKNVAANTPLIRRQALHARSLGFRHLDASQVSCEAPWPDDFREAVEALRSYKRWRA